MGCPQPPGTAPRPHGQRKTQQQTAPSVAREEVCSKSSPRSLAAPQGSTGPIRPLCFPCCWGNLAVPGGQRLGALRLEHRSPESCLSLWQAGEGGDEMLFCIPRPKMQSSERSFGCSDVPHVFKRPDTTYVMCRVSCRCPSSPPCSRGQALPLHNPARRTGQEQPPCKVVQRPNTVVPCSAPVCGGGMPKGRALAWAALPGARPFRFHAFGFKRISCNHFQVVHLETLPFPA